MENASKAIIITGAVMVVLLIITLSVYFYYQSTDITKIYGDKISITEIKNHNNAFLVYDGDVLGSEVINLCIRVKEYNANTGLPIAVTVKPLKNENHYSFDYENIGESYKNILNKIDRTLVYTCKVKYSNEGVINRIEIEPKK